jgi:aspartate kinase
MVIMKFGGSSVGNVEAMRACASIVGRFLAERPVVAVSALQGVTDLLIAAAKAAAAGKTAVAEQGMMEVRRRHSTAVQGAPDAAEDVERLLDECDGVLRALQGLRELSPRSLDLVVSFGERLSAPLVAAVFRQAGIPAEDVDARTMIETDDRFTSANVRFEATDRRIRETLLPIVEAGRVPVVTGFIGATADGVTTTLGRGGTDYTAAILGGALEAREIWIWKEVDGIMTADPRVVAEASTLEAISYDEAAEMSYFGAKVLHPMTMVPAVERGIPFRVRNTFRPELPGSRITADAPAAQNGVRVVTAIKKLAMVTIEGKGMTGIVGFAATVFSVAAKLGVNVLMFTQASSEQNICLIVAEGDAESLRHGLESGLSDALQAHRVENIRVEPDVAAVAVVGEGMRGRPGVAAGVFAAVGAAGINVLAIAQGSSERNISFIVAGKDADEAVRSVHRAFKLENVSRKVWSPA